MKENNATAVTMTEEERKEFEAFRASKAKKEAELREKKQRDEYKNMVEDEINASIPELLQISRDIRAVKDRVFENFKTILEMKQELFRVKDGQLSHTFTNSDGTKRIRLGMYVTDGYRDTVEEGISIVKEYIASLASDEKTTALVNMVMRLLSRDQQGTLKASRIVQLRKIAEETGDDRFMEGVQIIEESYQPEISKQYLRADQREVGGKWTPIPLGMTES